MDRPVDLAGQFTAARGGDRRALARLLTLLERAEPEVRAELVGLIERAAERPWLIGITGPPGVGKSSLVSAMIAALRAGGETVAVVAVDPSSPFTGGSLLGDRIRMQSHAQDAGVYIRSMAAGDQLGGLAATTPQSAALIGAAGFDVVLIETVGVGQSELDIVDSTDTTIVVLAPGAGDSIQAAKAGILEIADVFALNKADLAGAGQVESALQTMLEIAVEAGVGNTPCPPIVRTVAVRGDGVDQLLGVARQQFEAAERSGLAERRRRRRIVHRVRALAIERVRRVLDSSEGAGMIDAIIADDRGLDDVVGQVLDRAREDGPAQ